MLKPRWSRALAAGAIAVLAVVVAGCSSFNRQWRNAGKFEGEVPSGLAGRWEGEWRSDVNNHSGRLRCLITRRPHGDYKANYQAKYAKVFTFHYAVPLQTTNTEPPFHFEGEANLGKLAGGLYHYAGFVDTNSFFSTYKSKRDHGTFKMTRR